MPSEKEGIRQPTLKSVREDKRPEECRIKEDDTEFLSLKNIKK